MTNFSIVVSIIIVNYNTKDLLKKCLMSVFEKTKDVVFEVIVVDNNSTDGSVQMVRSVFPSVTIICNDKNIGFGAANNCALDIAQGEYVFYLNSDTLLQNNAVLEFVSYWNRNNNNDSIGALGCILKNECLGEGHSWGRFPTYWSGCFYLLRLIITNIIKTFFAVFHIDYRKLRSVEDHENRLGEVEYITGADLFMVRNENARFDERFFLYFEETDLQYQLKLKNKKRILISGPEIQHFCGGSNPTKKDIIVYGSFSSVQYFLSMVKYFKKNHYSFVGAVALKILILFVWVNPFLFLKTKRYYWELIRL